MDAGLVLVLALIFDLVFGEPPNRWHPVAWVGRLLAWGGRRAPRSSRTGLLASGVLLLLLALTLALGPIMVLTHYAELLGLAGLLFRAWLLKCTFSLRGLYRAAQEVRKVLASGQLDHARSLVGWHLVSRPTQRLSSHQVASATVESVAENLTDSVVAPLCFFLLGGLPAAWAYRVINTADAMLGYRHGELEYLGKAAARLDDLLNWVPARVAGLGIVLGAWVAGESARKAWQVMLRDRGLTASPNAGWTMAAMAGALGIVLEKPGAYQLGGDALPGVDAIDRALRVTTAASGLTVAGSLLAALLWR
jgi:adenosylcobinamide-phosphate synthase